jgi:hypothetical protein
MRGWTYVILAVGITTPAIAQDFLRGDVDGDGTAATIQDAMRIVPYLNPLPECMDAADANDDGVVNIVDLVHILAYMSNQGPPPPDPGPFSCGPDPTDDNLDCQAYDVCGAPEPPAVSPEHILRVPDTFGLTGGTVEIPVSYDNLSNNDGMFAFTMGLCHDPGVVTVLDVVAGSAYLPDPPDFAEFLLFPDGWAGQVLNSFIGVFPIVGADRQVLVALYDPVAEGTTSLTFCEDLGDPPTPILLSIGVPAVTPTTVDGSIGVNIVPFFRRGDANDDALVDIADPVFILNGLFVQGPPPPCPDASDGNDDGLVNIADSVFLLQALFANGPSPPAPGRVDCGHDPTEDGLDECQAMTCP